MFYYKIKPVFVKTKATKSQFSEKGNWISKKEFNRYLELLMWCTSTSGYRKSFYKMLNKFIAIWDQSGSTFLFQYLKEVMRLTVRRLSGIELEVSKKIFVKLNKYKFPAIIPLDLCEDILNKDKPWRSRLIVAVLSLISLFRVLPTKVKPDLTSIIEPFNGVSRSLDATLIREALVRLNMLKKGRNLELKMTLSQKAGPNGKISLFNTAIDALAFVAYPKNF